MLDSQPFFRKISLFFIMAVLVLFAMTQLSTSRLARAQDAVPEGSDPAGPAPFAGDPNAPIETSTATPPAAPASESQAKEINVLSLLVSGGFFMIPLAFLSVIVVTFSIERALGLRRSRVIPHELVTALARSSSSAGFDPRKAYRLCQEHPSATATVIRSMLLKVGRPHSEVEHAVAESSQREADRVYSNVRWLTMSAGVAPLIGLLGTVWGMIIAFHDTTQLAPGQNKADFLAEGIYIALVTTLGGLCVAIPAAMIAHYFEGRIQSMFHEIDELMFNLLPQIERYEGRVRFSRHHGEAEEPAGAPQPPPAPPVENRRPAVPAPK